MLNIISNDGILMSELADKGKENDVCFSPDVPVISVDNINHPYWNSLFHSLISLDRMQCILCN